MKTRIISAAAAFAVLAAVMLTGRRALGVMIFVASVLCIYEFYNAVQKAGIRPVKLIGYISCLPLLYTGITGTDFLQEPQALAVITAGIFVLLVAALATMVFRYGHISLTDISVTFFGIVYIVFMFSFVSLVRNLEEGWLFFWLVLIGAWATDIFAYFTGVLTGKHKILPEVSPKKTLEGSLGGIAGCVAAMVLYGVYINTLIESIPLYHFVALGLICGCISQVGDWAASAIKRYVGIKDYGNIMPGHGGLLDRCDSILLTAPAVYFYVTIILK